MTHGVTHWMRIRMRSILRVCSLASTAIVMIAAIGTLALAQSFNVQDARTVSALTIKLAGLPTGLSVNVTIALVSREPTKVLRLSGAGEIAVKLAPGTYVVAGLAVPGYSAPASQRVTVAAGQPSTVTLTYSAIPGAQTPGVQAPGVQTPGVQAPGGRLQGYEPQECRPRGCRPRECRPQEYRPRECKPRERCS